MQFELVRAQDPEGHFRSLVVPPAALNDTLVHISESEGVELSVTASFELSNDTSSNFQSLSEADPDVCMCITISELQRGFTCLYEDAVRLSRRRILEQEIFLPKREVQIPRENPAPMADDSDAVLGWLQRNPAFRIVNSPTRGLRYAAYPLAYHKALQQLLGDTVEMLVESIMDKTPEN